MVRNAMKEGLPRSHAPRVLVRRREAPRNVVRRFGSQSQASRLPPAHGHHLQDALGKLKGLADFAEEYSNHFVRIDAISKNDKGDLGGDTKGALLLLDLLDSDVRKVVRASASATDAYRDAGVRYE
jgi:hypothetical protein